MNWIFWGLLSALFAGLTAILAKVGLENINSQLALVIRTIVVLILTWILAIPVLSKNTIASIDRRTWLFLVLSGLATGLSWVCYFRALQLGKVSQVAALDKFSVAIAIVLAMVFLGERLSIREGVGAGLIVVGAMVLVWK